MWSAAATGTCVWPACSTPVLGHDNTKLLDPAEVSHCIAVRFVSTAECLGHTVYQIEVTAESARRWFVEKRYSDVRELYQRLSMWLSERQPPIPGKRLWGNHDADFIQERRIGLERYLSRTIHMLAEERPFLLGTLMADFLASDPGDKEHLRALADGLALKQASKVPTVEAAKPVAESVAMAVKPLTAQSRQAGTRHSGVRSVTPLRHPQPDLGSAAGRRSDTPCRRQRRWSRRHQVAEEEVVAPASSLHGEGAVHLSVLGEDLQASVVAEIPGENTAEPSQAVGLSSASSQAAWDWPLSRQERKARVALIDQHMSQIDRSALLGEIRRLQSRVGMS
mmetsp:Transcript_59736/g.142132  ORF Transcript_59736/g.142132 Transcript_59736/m.142132 type:complete len:337 (+) Transcript_59736:32-1042(+)